MIQEQQQQTNQWVLTPVQFNLVKTEIIIIDIDQNAFKIV